MLGQDQDQDHTDYSRCLESLLLANGTPTTAPEVIDPTWYGCCPTRLGSDADDVEALVSGEFGG